MDSFMAAIELQIVSLVKKIGYISPIHPWEWRSVLGMELACMQLSNTRCGKISEIAGKFLNLKNFPAMIFP